MSAGLLPNEHFLTLVDHGRHRGASSGCKAARKLARAICEEAPSLDATAIAGLHQWVDYCKAMPGTAADVIELGSDILAERAGP